MAPRRRRSLVIRFAWLRTFYLFFLFFLHGTFLAHFCTPLSSFFCPMFVSRSFSDSGPGPLVFDLLFFAFWFFDACCIATFLNYDTHFSLKYSSVCEGSSFTF